MTINGTKQPEPGSSLTTTTTTPRPHPVRRTWSRKPRTLSEADLDQIQQALSSLETLSPSHKPTKFLYKNILSPTATRQLVLEIAKHQPQLDPSVCHILLNKLERNVAYNCSMKMSALKNFHQNPFSLTFCAGFIKKYNSYSRKLDRQPPTNQNNPSHAAVSINVPSNSKSKAEALQQIHHYACKIISRHLRETSPKELCFDPWFFQFINDLAKLRVKDKVSLTQLVNETNLKKHPLKESLLSFLEGTWNPEQRTVRDLSTTVLQTRQKIIQLAHFCLKPPSSLLTALQQMRESVLSGRFRQIFSQLLTEQDLQLGEQLLLDKDSIIHAAAATLPKNKTSTIRTKARSITPFLKSGDTSPLWVLKLRPSTNESIHVTISTPIVSGTSKLVSLVATVAGKTSLPCIPWPVYAYATSKMASGKGILTKNLKLQIFQTQASEPPAVTALRTKILQNIENSVLLGRAQLAHTAQIAQLVGPDISILSIPIFKKEPSHELKGIAMEYFRHTLLFFDTTAIETSKRLTMAIDLCSIVARMHDAGVVHLDLSFRNVLCQEGPSGIVVKLCDFDSSKKSFPPSFLDQRTATLAPPEMMTASPQAPLKVGPGIDNWALGVFLVKIIFGGTGWRLLAQETPISQSQVISLLQSKSRDLDPLIIRTIQGLLAQNPEERWTAREAQETLQNALRTVQK